MPLPQLVKDRLASRETLDISVKKSNEYRVREYVKDHFTDLDEIVWILGTLPEKQLKRLFKDMDVYRFLDLAVRAMVALDFMPVQLSSNGEWVAGKSLVVRSKDNNVRRMFSMSGPATDQDQERFSTLRKYLSDFGKFTDPKARPVYNALDKIYYKDLIKDAKRNGYEPVEPGDLPTRFWLPKLTEEQKEFRKLQDLLSDVGIYVDSPEELMELKEKIRLDRLKEEKKLATHTSPTNRPPMEATR